MSSQKSINNKEHLRESIEVYLSKWKFILLGLIIALVLGFLYLRYATYEYKASATIKIKDDESNNKLPEISSLQNYGLFKTDLNNVVDEIEVIRSRFLIGQVVEELKLNIQFYVQGRFKGHEAYKNPPLNITFSTPDSILKQVDTTFNIQIKSATEFYFQGINNETSRAIIQGKKIDDNLVLFNFGESVPTGFGNVIITPNIGEYGSTPGSDIEIKISPINNVIGSYKTRLITEIKETSSVIKLSINDNCKEKAEDFLNKLIEKYNQDVINDKQLVVKATSDFINNRLEVVSQELEAVDLTAESLKKTNKLTDLQTQSSLFLETEKENETRLIETSNQIQLIDYMSNYLGDNDKPSDLLPSNIGIQDPSVEQVTRRHNQLVLERNRILKNSSEKNPTVVNLDNEINAIKENLKQSLNNFKTSNEITLNNLEAESARINSQIYSAPKKERQFRDIKRQQDIKEALYLYLLQKREESAIKLGVSAPNAKIVDQAYASSEPVTPKKMIVLLSSFLLGLSVPVGFIYLKNILDSKVHTMKDVKQFVDLPYLGDIPKVSSKQQLVKEFDYSPKAEAFRIVRTNIDFMLQNINDRARIIFITSTTSQEGKSHTSINLALSLSFSRKKVLLIETDIRVPKATNYLNMKNENGVTDYISNTDLIPENVISHIKDNDYLDIIPSGPIPPNPAELLLNHRIDKLFDSVKGIYDYIIVDTAAVGLVTDTLLIAKHADLTVYVVRANYMDKRQLHVLEKLQNESRLPNLAVLINSVTPKSGYGYGYGYGKNPKKKKWKLF
ncbi:GumC family protein [Mangrovimonas aestuarii]|uniref:GumC family protein n=1 Tax=Mangrovimonas aestuarii TaxID=3018443 RepID=UPI0023790250|nr:polysaccharide biosynthesis tyrosine autokinase [Mangrovimonas aestuarii]